ncbi:MAG: ketopantoate reductase family protein [Thiohalospira sp.]
MSQPVILQGVGELGGVFARALLRAGHPVYPVTRDMAPREIEAEYPEPALVLLTVGEADLHPALEAMPEAWRQRVGLLQNELLPRDWEAHGIEQPTVIAAWFEKKPGQDHKVVIPSPAHGPAAGLLVEALNGLGIPAREVNDAAAMRFELVRKNVYILTTNIAGLECGGTVTELWRDHQELARQVAHEVMDIQAWLTGEELDREALIDGMVEAFEGDPDHKNTGRSAPARLARAIEHADAAGLSVPRLRELHARQSG